MLLGVGTRQQMVGSEDDDDDDDAYAYPAPGIRDGYWRPPFSQMMV